MRPQVTKILLKLNSTKTPTEASLTNNAPVASPLHLFPLRLQRPPSPASLSTLFAGMLINEHRYCQNISFSRRVRKSETRSKGGRRCSRFNSLDIQPGGFGEAPSLHSTSGRWGAVCRTRPQRNFSFSRRRKKDEEVRVFSKRDTLEHSLVKRSTLDLPKLVQQGVLTRHFFNGSTYISLKESSMLSDWSHQQHHPSTK